MSARIKVRRSPYLHGFIWWDCSVPLCPGGYGGGNTLAAAADAGRKHLREVHDEAEAAAKYARDTTPDWEYLRSLAHKAPRVRRQVSNYCRAHGCHRGECGCGCIQTPKPDESGSDFVPTISAACIGGDARTQIHICTKCGLVSSCNGQPNGARA